MAENLAWHTELNSGTSQSEPLSAVYDELYSSQMKASNSNWMEGPRPFELPLSKAGADQIAALLRHANPGDADWQNISNVLNDAASGHRLPMLTQLLKIHLKETGSAWSIDTSAMKDPQQKSITFNRTNGDSKRIALD